MAKKIALSVGIPTPSVLFSADQANLSKIQSAIDKVIQGAADELGAMSDMSSSDDEEARVANLNILAGRLGMEGV